MNTLCISNDSVTKDIEYYKSQFVEEYFKVFNNIPGDTYCNYIVNNIRSILRTEFKYINSKYKPKYVNTIYKCDNKNIDIALRLMLFFKNKNDEFNFKQFYREYIINKKHIIKQYLPIIMSKSYIDIALYHYFDRDKKKLINAFLFAIENINNKYNNYDIDYFIPNELSLMCLSYL